MNGDTVTQPTAPCTGAVWLPLNPLFMEIEAGAWPARPVARWICPDPACGQVHEERIPRTLLPHYAAHEVRIYRHRWAEEADAWRGDTGRCQH